MGKDRGELPSLGFPHVWVEADAHSWPRDAAGGWGSCQVSSCLWWLFGEEECCCGAITVHSSPLGNPGWGLCAVGVIVLPR